MSDDRPGSPIGSSAAYCRACERETDHHVAIEIADTSTERIDERNRKYARGPCRVLTCRRCGSETRLFVNR